MPYNATANAIDLKMIKGVAESPDRSGKLLYSPDQVTKQKNERAHSAFGGGTNSINELLESEADR